MSEELKDLTSPEYIENNSEKIESEYVLAIKDDIEKFVSVDLLSDDQKDAIIKKALSTLPIDDDGGLQDHLQDKGHGNIETWIYNVEPWLEENFSTGKENDKHLLSKTKEQANLLFSSVLVSSVNESYRQYGSEPASKLADSIMQNYLGLSPNITSYTGGLPGYLGLLSLSDRNAVSRGLFWREISGEVIYTYSFGGDKESFIKPLENKSELQLLYLLSVEHHLGRNALFGSDYGRRAFDKIEYAMAKVAESFDLPPLIRAVAAGKVEDIDPYIKLSERSYKFLPKFPSHKLDVYQNLDSDFYRRRAHDVTEGEIQIEQTSLRNEQISLHNQFKNFKEEDRLSMVAPDVCGNVVAGNISTIIDKDGRKTSITDWRPDNDFGIAEDDMFLIRVAHEGYTKKIIESKLGVGLDKINLNTQIRFLRFALEADDGRYDRLTKQLLKFENESDKIQLIDAFLSLEFGDDFGDRLLNISEKMDGRAAENIFGNINKIRHDSEAIASYFDDSGNNVDLAVKTAWIKRTTELLAIIANNESTEQDINSAVDALRVMQYATEQIEKGLEGNINLYSDTDKDSNADHVTLKSENGLTLTLRSYGGSPRIGFTVKIPDSLIPEDVDKLKDKRLSIRLDLDEHGLSLDIGSDSKINANVSAIGHFIGEQMSKGELAMGRNELNGYHVREAFESINITKDSFADIVHKFVGRLNVTGLESIPKGEEHAA